MQTLGELQSFVQDVFNDTSSKVETSIQRFAQIAIKDVRRQLRLNHLLYEQSITTVAAQRAYNLAVDCRFVESVRLVSGGVSYFPKPIDNRDQWNSLIDGANEPSDDSPTNYFINASSDGLKIEIYPKPSTAGNIITVVYQSFPKDYASTDFTDKSTGTVSITNGLAAVVGVGTSFAATDVGRYIRFTADGYWYRITAVADATHLTIHKNFEGVTVAGGAFLIGYLPNLPVEGMDIVADMILKRLWEKREDFSIAGGKATYYEDRAKNKLKKLYLDFQNNTTSPTVNVLDSWHESDNPNDFPQNVGN